MTGTHCPCLWPDMQAEKKKNTEEEPLFFTRRMFSHMTGVGASRGKERDDGKKNVMPG